MTVVRNKIRQSGMLGIHGDRYYGPERHMLMIFPANQNGGNG